MYISNIRNTLPFIAAFCTGKIKYLNEKAMRAFPKKKIGEPIPPLIEENIFFKMTMKRNGITLVDTNDSKYKKAISRTLYDNIEKIVDLVFLNDEYFFDEENIRKIRKLFMAFGFINASPSINVNLDNTVRNIIDELSASKYFAHKRITCNSKLGEEMPFKDEVFEALFLAGIAILNELDFCEPIYVQLEKKNQNTILKISQKTHIENLMSAAGELSVICPPALPRIEFINIISEENDIVSTVFSTHDTVTISFEFPYTVADKRVLKAWGRHAPFEERIKKIAPAILY